MSIFVLELVFFISVGLIVYLFVRKLPQVRDVAEVSETPIPARRGLFHSEWIDKIDNKFIEMLSKWLRKAKLIVMRLDNFVSRHIETVKRKHEQKMGGPNVFKELDQENVKEQNGGSDVGSE